MWSVSTVFCVNVIKFIEYRVCLVCLCNDVRARVNPLTQKVLMLYDVASEGGSRRVLESEDEGMRFRAVESLNEPLLDPLFERRVL